MQPSILQDDCMFFVEQIILPIGWVILRLAEICVQAVVSGLKRQNQNASSRKIPLKIDNRELTEEKSEISARQKTKGP